MKKFLLLLATLGTLSSQAQDEVVTSLKNDAQRTITKDASDTSAKVWKTGGFFNVNVAQGSLSNWAAGGDKFSLAINSNVSAYAFYKKGKHSWDNTLDLNIGYINTTTLGTRKNDDRIDLVSKYGYALSEKLNVGALFNFRSQMFKGYIYDGDGNREFASNFLAPAYVLFSPGIEWKPTKEFSAFVSPATVRWTIVTSDLLSAKGAYGVDTGSHVKTEFGAFGSLNYMKEVNKTLTFKSRLDLFSNYLKDPQNIDLYWTNMLSLKLSKVLSLTYNLDLIYDDDVRLFGPNGDGARTQLKSMLGLGFMVKF